MSHQSNMATDNVAMVALDEFVRAKSQGETHLTVEVSESGHESEAIKELTISRETNGANNSTTAIATVLSEVVYDEHTDESIDHYVLKGSAAETVLTFLDSLNGKVLDELTVFMDYYNGREDGFTTIDRPELVLEYATNDGSHSVAVHFGGDSEVVTT